MCFLSLATFASSLFTWNLVNGGKKKKKQYFWCVYDLHVCVHVCLCFLKD